jgi:integrase/recombinase XerD
MRHEDIDIGGCLVRVVPRDNANGARVKGGRGREIPASAPLMRLYADYLNREYQAIDSDYVFVNLWAGPAARPMTYPAGAQDTASGSLPRSGRIRAECTASA